MLDSIMFTFDKNFQRLNNLINLYGTLSGGKGRKSASSLDLLRSTTVLAHSTLEDYLRSLLMWKMPLIATSEKLNQIPLFGTSANGTRRTKFELGDLTVHKGKTVDELISLSIKEYLGSVSFNDTRDIAGALNSISIEVTAEIKNTFTPLNDMIKRRHNIVHRADKADQSGSGNHSYKSISLKQVNNWKIEIDKFVTEVNKNFD